MTECRGTRAELAVARLVRAARPPPTRIDQGRLYVGADRPRENCPQDKLRAVVASQVARRAAKAGELRQALDHARGADAAAQVDREALARVFVGILVHAEHTDLERDPLIRPWKSWVGLFYL